MARQAYGNSNLEGSVPWKKAKQLALLLLQVTPPSAPQAQRKCGLSSNARSRVRGITKQRARCTPISIETRQKSKPLCNCTPCSFIPRSKEIVACCSLRLLYRAFVGVDLELRCPLSPCNDPVPVVMLDRVQVGTQLSLLPWPPDRCRCSPSPGPARGGRRGARAPRPGLWRRRRLRFCSPSPKKQALPQRLSARPMPKPPLSGSRSRSVSRPPRSPALGSPNTETHTTEGAGAGIISEWKMCQGKPGRSSFEALCVRGRQPIIQVEVERSRVLRRQHQPEAQGASRKQRRTGGGGGIGGESEKGPARLAASAAATPLGRPISNPPRTANGQTALSNELPDQRTTYKC